MKLGYTVLPCLYYEHVVLFCRAVNLRKSKDFEGWDLREMDRPQESEEREKRGQLVGEKVQRKEKNFYLLKQ